LLLQKYLRVAAAAVSSYNLFCGPVLIVFVVLIDTDSDAGKDDILHQFVNAADLAQQIKLMRLVSLC